MRQRKLNHHALGTLCPMLFCNVAEYPIETILKVYIRKAAYAVCEPGNPFAKGLIDLEANRRML